MVAFPLNDVDISEYVAQRTFSVDTLKNTAEHPKPPPNSNTKALQTHGGVWSPWRKPKRICLQQSEEKFIYDLYAVSNHHGKDLQGGHYTGE